MAHEPIPAIEKILSDVDGTMRRRLAKQGLDGTDHIILAIAPDGGAIIRSNCGPEALKAIAAMLIEIAEQVDETGEGKPH